MSSMSFAVRLSRVALFGIALVLGSFGIFSFYWSCMGAALAQANDHVGCSATA